MEPSAAKTKKWNLSQKMLFRFFFVFYSIEIFRWLFISMSWLPPNVSFQNGLLHNYHQFWDSLVTWIGKHVLNLDVGKNHDQDSLFSYVDIFARLLIALVGCLIWSIADPKRTNYRTPLYWLTVYLRYYLASVVLSYGFGKLFFLQFNTRFGDLEKLVSPYGNFSPPQLLANFMGYSKSYELFTGAMEVLGGILLFFRRTTTLGALILFGVITNVFLLNYNFSFGVIEYSFELLLIAAFLLAIDARRIINLFLLNIIAYPVEKQPAISKKWMKVVKVILKAYFILFICLYSDIKYNLQYYFTYVRGPDPPLHGIYKVNTFVINKDTLPPLASDKIRWARMIVSFPGWVNIHMMNDTSISYDYKPDTANKRFIISSYRDTLAKYLLNYNIPRSDILILYGIWKQDSIFIQLQKEDINKYKLTRWKTGWVNQSNQ